MIHWQLNPERVVLVTGARDWEDFEMVWQALSDVGPYLVLQGGCETGADEMARRWCVQNGVPFLTYPAHWQAHGRNAGPVRNEQLINCLPVGGRVLAFPLGNGGTEDCMARARKRGYTVTTYAPLSKLGGDLGDVDW